MIETAKSVLLAFLVTAFVLLIGEMWLQPAQLGSPPPATAGLELQVSAGSLRQVIQPLQVVVSRQGRSRAYTPGSAGDEVWAVSRQLMSKMLEGDAWTAAGNGSQSDQTASTKAPETQMMINLPASLDFTLWIQIWQHAWSDLDLTVPALPPPDTAETTVDRVVLQDYGDTVVLRLGSGHTYLERSLTPGQLPPRVLEAWRNLDISGGQPVTPAPKLVGDWVIPPYTFEPGTWVAQPTYLTHSEPLPDEQDVLSFFPHPEVVRRVDQSENGSQFYTDGTRSLRLHTSGRIVYDAEPSGDSASNSSGEGLEMTAEEALLHALTFIDGHGGIPERLRLTSMSTAFIPGSLSLESGFQPRSHRVEFGVEIDGKLLKGTQPAVLVEVADTGVIHYRRMVRKPTRVLYERAALDLTESLGEIRRQIPQLTMDGAVLTQEAVTGIELGFNNQQFPTPPVWIVRFSGGHLLLMNAHTGRVYEPESQ